jgi:hypothetical protein
MIFLLVWLKQFLLILFCFQVSVPPPDLQRLIDQVIINKV